MCGIFAYLSQSKISDELKIELTKKAMLSKMRGPDNTVSRMVDEYKYLVFHRLCINDLSDKQLEYAANDVIYLHKIKKDLEKMLIRENRMDLYNRCISFLDSRIELDQSGFKFDIFEH